MCPRNSRLPKGAQVSRAARSFGPSGARTTGGLAHLVAGRIAWALLELEATGVLSAEDSAAFAALMQQTFTSKSCRPPMTPRDP